MNDIRRLRQNLGLSRQQLGVVLGVTYQTIWNLENREYKNGPSPLVQEKLHEFTRELAEGAKGE